MISGKNKIIALSISSIIVLISWVIIFIDIILNISTAFQFGISQIDSGGFILTTLLATFYTVFLIFKFRSFATFPLILMLLHLATLNGSILAILFVSLDLALTLLLNINSGETKPIYEQNNTNQSTNSHINSDNVFDAEYHTKE